MTAELVNTNGNDLVETPKLCEICFPPSILRHETFLTITFGIPSRNFPPDIEEFSV